MHTVDILEQALAAARQLGFRIRHEWLGGAGGADCLLKGQKWIFLDLAQTPQEQLEGVLEALQSDPQLTRLQLVPELRGLLDLRRTA